MLKKIGSIISFAPLIIFGAELNFVASVNRTEVGVGEPLLLTVSVEGEDIGQIPSPQLPDLPDFRIGGTSTSQSTNIQMAGGRVIKRQFINFVYTLYPKETGNTVIGACKLEYRGEIYNTQPIEISVVKGTARSSQPPPGVSPMLQEPGQAIDDDLKLVATVNRKSVYQGELVVVEYSLYTRLRIADINLAESPTFSGFWVEQISDAQQRIDWQRKTIAGKAYDVSVLRRFAMFPMTTGRLQIAPMKLNVTVIQSPRDFFDIFSTTKVVPVTSDIINIDVVPLPAEGRPKEFTGAVGKFAVEAVLDRNHSEAGEPINLIVKIGGAGNVKLIEKPVLPIIAGAKVLDPEIKEKLNYSGGAIRGHKEFRFPLIPQTDGEHIVPNITVAYFDPTDKKYHRISTEKLKFTATQAAAAVEIAQTGGLKVLGTDIRYIKPDVSLLKDQRGPKGSWFVLLYLLSVGAIGLAVVYHRHRAKLLSDIAYARKLRSSRLVRERLKEAEQHLNEGNKKQFHATVSKVVLGYIGDRYNLDVGSMTSEELMEELRQKDVKSEITTKLRDLLTRCDMRFSPRMEFDNPQMLLQMVRELLAGL